MGRFISADAYASTGQGILGNNMFAFCMNNPISYSDYTGSACSYACFTDDVLTDLFQASDNGCCGGFGLGISNFYRNIDDARGKYALEETSGQFLCGTYSGKLMFFDYSLLGIADGGITLIDMSAGMFDSAWQLGNLTFSPLNYFTTELSAGLTRTNGLYLNAMAYINSSSVSFSIGSVQFTFTGYIGAIGRKAAIGPNGVSYSRATNGLGWVFSIDW